jgi:hypothetical protein
MYNLLIPILATCFINAETQSDKQIAMNNKPRLAYIYAIDTVNKHVYADFSGLKLDTKKIKLDNLRKIDESKCAPLIKNDMTGE